ncbi:MULTISPECIES: MASE1 domain-containing protein [Ramlibacter]|uniref:Uncharacterized protein n=1 Tax=Ramlibacter pinisoli TaxID=2682844 RepID=A0A6N8INH4_9BURK|nr:MULTISPECIES: MASE1 domain-containing protein [Ramlibacter]MBA2960539.1 MASE1 domain-containing protein [Ramlibacter sp. CGMCC 1.13660]MVQ27870.1 hypothetical protein [Ramlibacter pinisoli]
MEERTDGLAHVAVTILAFLVAFAINHWLFASLEFAPGINFVYLPAGIRLLATLLFAEAGAIGLLIVSWLVSFYLFPNDHARAFAGGIIASIAPYLVYLGARHFYGVDRGIDQLKLEQLLTLSLAYSVASPLLHHLWFASRGQSDVLPGFSVMFIGDLVGTLVVVFAFKGGQLLLRQRNR